MTLVTLPIDAFSVEIVKTVRANQVTIIVAETGAGKSTRVPRFLMGAGHTMVITQPRRLAARTVAARVAEELGQKVGQMVGIRTREDRIENQDTRILFATDGLAMIRELMGIRRYDILVLDEVHEWNMNMEVIIAWSKLQVTENPNFKLVLMSATLEAEKLSAFFNGAPVINVPGRLFPVTEQQAGEDEVNDVKALLEKRRNVLVFMPGKGDIGKFIGNLSETGVNAEILPLHGELTPEEQARCFKSYGGKPKCVVSTNVAQTSVTIPDIDAVVDSGMERRVECVNGVEGLYLKAVSYADAKQRKGRAGRTKPGIYIDHCGSAERLDFPKAEILRRRLDQTVLRLAEAGFDAETLEFFHQPEKEAIHEARRLLHMLGCIDENDAVTPKGHQVTRMPVSVEAACMIMEAEKQHVYEDILIIAAILEVGEITSDKDTDGKLTFAWKKLCPDETESDLLAQLIVFKAAEKLPKDRLRANGINSKNFFAAQETHRHLAETLKGKFQNKGSSGDRLAIKKSIAAGMVDHLYYSSYGCFINGDQVERQLNKSSIIEQAKWIVGRPWDLDVKGKHGTYTLFLVRAATKVDPLWLTEVAPHLVKIEESRAWYDSLKDSVVIEQKILFNDQVLGQNLAERPNHPDAQRLFCEYLASQSTLNKNSPESSSSGKFISELPASIGIWIKRIKLLET